MCGRLQIILEVGLEIVMTSFLISGQRQGLASEVENLTKFINCFEVSYYGSNAVGRSDFLLLFFIPSLVDHLFACV